MSQASLMRLFNFTAEDLAANIEGQYSEAQLADLRKKRAADMRMFIYSMIAATIFVGSTVCLVGILVVGVLATPQMATTVGFLLASVVAAFMVYAIRERYLAWEQVIDVRKVSAIEGQATKINRITRRGPLYRVVLTGEARMSFSFNRMQFAAFQEGGEYRIYYTPKMLHILSVEVIRELK